MLDLFLLKGSECLWIKDENYLSHDFDADVLEMDGGENGRGGGDVLEYGRRLLLVKELLDVKSVTVLL